MQSKNPAFQKSLWKIPNLYMTIPGIYLLLVAAVGAWLIYWDYSEFSFPLFFHVQLFYIIPSILGSTLLLYIKKKGLIVSLILLFCWQIIASFYFFAELSMKFYSRDPIGPSFDGVYPVEWLFYELIFVITNSVMIVLLVKARKLFPPQETVKGKLFNKYEKDYLERLEEQDKT